MAWFLSAAAHLFKERRALRQLMNFSRWISGYLYFIISLRYLQAQNVKEKTNLARDNDRFIGV